MFQEITPYLLCASKRISSIPYDSLSLEEVNELEITEKGVSIQTFREQSCEIILRAYILLQANFGADGASSIFRTLFE